MREITILGAGVSGLALIEEIRDKGIDCGITLIDKNSCNFPGKELTGDITKRIELSEWAKEKKVKFILACAVKINPRQQKIYFRDGGPEKFDNLIVASGLISKKLPVKGGHKDGFFYLSDADPLKIRSFLAGAPPRALPPPPALWNPRAIPLG